MEENIMIALRLRLKQLSSQDLEDMFRAEARKDPPDYDLLLTILHILEERNAEAAVELTPEEESVWKNYQKRVKSRAGKPAKPWAQVLRIACMLLIIGVLFCVIPQTAEADGFWDRIARWSADFFEFFNPYSVEKPKEEYVFQTDNPGLRQVYDAVVELGITDPVVPMWLPEGYELVEYETNIDFDRSYVCVLLSDEENEIVLKFILLNCNINNQYMKDQQEVSIVEIYGQRYNILRNEGKWVVIWSEDNRECAFTIDCQEDTLHKILKSIYSMEE